MVLSFVLSQLADWALVFGVGGVADAAFGDHFCWCIVQSLAPLLMCDPFSLPKQGFENLGTNNEMSMLKSKVSAPKFVGPRPREFGELHHLRVLHSRTVQLKQVQSLIRIRWGHRSIELC